MDFSFSGTLKQNEVSNAVFLFVVFVVVVVFTMPWEITINFAKYNHFGNTSSPFYLITVHVVVLNRRKVTDNC